MSIPHRISIFQGYILNYLNDTFEEFEEIFSYFWNSYHITKVIIIQQVRKCFSIYNFKIFEQGKCRKVQPFFSMNICNKNDPNISKIFYNPLKNMEKCPVRVINDQDVFNNTNVLYYEEFIIEQFTKSLNSTLVMQSLEGNIYEYVLKRSQDLVFGTYLLHYNRTLYLDNSFPYYVSHYFLVIKHSKVPKNSLTYMLERIEVGVWLILIVSYISCAIIISFKEKSEFTENILMIHAVLAGVSINKFRKLKGILVEIIIPFLILGFIFPSDFHGLLFQSLTVDHFEALPRNLEEIYSTGYSDTLVSDKQFFEEIETSFSDPRKLKPTLLFKEVENTLNAVNESGKNLVGLVDYVFWSLYGYVSGGGPQNFYKFPKRYSTDFACFYLYKNSFLTETLDDTIFRIMEGGHYLKLKIKENYLSSKNLEEAFPIGIHQMICLMKLYAFFVTIAFLTFILELAFNTYCMFIKTKF